MEISRHPPGLGGVHAQPAAGRQGGVEALQYRVPGVGGPGARGGRKCSPSGARRTGRDDTWPNASVAWRTTRRLGESLSENSNGRAAWVDGWRTRVRNTRRWARATLLAMLLSVLVGWQVTSLLQKRQDATIQGSSRGWAPQPGAGLVHPPRGARPHQSAGIEALTLIRRTGAVKDAGRWRCWQCESSAVRMGES